MKLLTFKSSSKSWKTTKETCSEHHHTATMLKILQMTMTFYAVFVQCRFRQLAHIAYICTPTTISICTILGMHTLTHVPIPPLWFVKVFKNFLVLIYTVQKVTAIYVTFKDWLFEIFILGWNFNSVYNYMKNFMGWNI